MTRGASITVALLAAIGCGADAGRPDAGLPVEERTWQDEVVYQLLTDRFANGSSANDTGDSCATCYQGGDWVGITQQLDYLVDLGVTAIWISPVAKNVDDVIGAGYHGFWPLALDEVNPQFGSEAELAALVDECHARGIKVLIDVVLNHLGPIFYYDINGNGMFDAGELAPTYDGQGIPGNVVFHDGVSPAAFANADWYHRRGEIVDFNDPEQSLYGDFEGGLRDLDSSREDVRQALLAVTLDWLDRVAFDGIRFDAAKHVEDDFFPWFLGELRAQHPGLLAVAEAFDGDVGRLAEFTTLRKFDSVLDFAVKYQAFDAVFVNGAPTSSFADVHVAQQSAYADMAHPGGAGPAPVDIPMRFLDNHDVPRFLSLVQDSRKLKAALAYLLTIDGVPVLYYGTEQDFAGAGDPDNREAMWPTGYATDGDTYVWMRRLIELRARYRALRRGDVRFVWTSEQATAGTGAGVVAFERFVGDDRVLVVVNTSAEAAATEASGTGMQVGFAPGTELVEVLVGDAGLVVPSSARIRVELPGFGARIFVAAPK